MRLTRKATIFLFLIGLISLFGLGFFLGGSSLFDDVQKEQEDTSQYAVTLVKEDQKITSTYLEVAAQKNPSEYEPCHIVIKAGTKVGGYQMTHDQTFTKYMLLKGPDGKEVITNKSKQPITHYAYSMLLIGDVQKKTNLSNQEVTYEIVNARITYNRIPFVLLSNENNVCIRNTKKTKEKIIKRYEFTDALKSVEKRDSVISW